METSENRSSDRIYQWLASVSRPRYHSPGDHPDARIGQSAKRPRSPVPELPLSPKSLAVPMSPSPKRARTGATGHPDDNAPLSITVDGDATPRRPAQTPAAVLTAAHDDSTSLPAPGTPTTTTGTASSLSGTSLKRGRQSPTKQLASLDIHDVCHEVSLRGPFYGNDRRPPLKLAALNKRLASLGHGQGILPSSPAGEAARERARHDQSFEALDSPFSMCQTGDREGLGPTPAPDLVQALFEEADECRRHSHSEAEWNQVHRDVFKLALASHRQRSRPTNASPSCRIDIANCTTAQIVRSYLPPLRPRPSDDPFTPRSYTPSTSQRHQQLTGKRVDFCVFIDAHNLDTARHRAAASPHESLNHTDYAPLLARPIALSIETKKPGGNLDEAKTQMNIWQIAHWNRLDELVSHTAAAKRAAAAPDPGAAREPASESWSAAAASGLDFLPGIIIHGDDWWFLASTRPPPVRTSFTEGSTDKAMGVPRADECKTFMYHKTCIGNTSTVEGIYSLVASIQVLAAWIQDDFWPWYQHAALGAE